MRQTFIIFTLVVLTSCNSNVATKTEVRRKVDYYKLYPEIKDLLGVSNYDPDGNSWTLVTQNDSTCKIYWSTTKSERKGTLEFPFSIARHFRPSWTNSKFLVLRSHTGSDSWFDVFLPLDTTRQEFVIYQPLTQDQANNYVLAQGYQDTIFKIHNLCNGLTMEVLETEYKCESVSWFYCIDSISVCDWKFYYRLKPTSTSKKPKEINGGFRL